MLDRARIAFVGAERSERRVAGDDAVDVGDQNRKVLLPPCAEPVDPVLERERMMHPRRERVLDGVVENGRDRGNVLLMGVADVHVSASPLRSGMHVHSATRSIA